MMVDNILLGQADILVAAMRSSFTQGLPLVMLMDRHQQQQVSNGPPRPRFCEVSEAGDAMTCVGNRQDWLFRRDPFRQWTWSVNATQETVAPVVHAAVFHFPDADRDAKSQHEFQTTVDFLMGNYARDPNSTLRIWGRGFNQKYRKKTGGSFTTEWNIQS